MHILAKPYGQWFSSVLIHDCHL